MTAMADEEEPREAGAWERGFEGHERAQLARLAALPMSEKLRWLEEAHRVVRHLQGVRDPQVLGG
jgi:hypothetical protein